MKIRHIYIIRGPNYWSIRRHKLIVMVLDLLEMEGLPTDKVAGFYERLKAMFPGMYEHRCSEGVIGGFFQRVEKGTWMGHVIEHIALEIQTLAGMEVGFGRTRSYGEKGVYHVVFSYMEEDVGRFAAESAVAICEALIKGAPYPLEDDIHTMREIRRRERLGPSTSSIIEEAESRGIPWIRLNKYSLCQLGQGVNIKRIQATVTSETSNIGVELASDKTNTKELLSQAGIRVPPGENISELDELAEACRRLGFPLVIKPIDGNHGRGVTVNIQNYANAVVAFHLASTISENIIVEKYIVGDDYRLLVIDNKFVAAAKRTPAYIIGNGVLTIQQLIDTVNKDPRRGYGHVNVLTLIKVDGLTKKLLKKEDTR